MDFCFHMHSQPYEEHLTWLANITFWSGKLNFVALVNSALSSGVGDNDGSHYDDSSESK